MDSYPTAPFQGNTTLLGIGLLIRITLKYHAKRFAHHLLDKVIQICSQHCCRSKRVALTGVLPWYLGTVWTCWAYGSGQGLYDYDSACLDVGPYWLVKAIQELSCEWVLVVLNSFFRVEIIPLPQRSLDSPLLRESSVDPYDGQF